MVNKNIVILVFCLAFSMSMGQVLNPFLSTPLFNNRLFTFGSANVVKAAPDQSMIVVGYSNGSVVGYNMNGNFMYQFLGPSSGIQQLTWVPTIGPMSIDSSGMVYLWFKNGSLVSSLNMGNTYTRMSVTTSSLGLNYVAFASFYNIAEYQISGFGFTSSRSYSPPSGMYFVGPIMYSAGYSVLFTSAYSGANSIYTLYAYSCSSGNILSSFQLPGSSSVQAFAPFTNGNYIMLLSSNYVYSFSTNLFPTNLGPTSTYSQVMTTCLQGPYIVTAAFSSYPVTIWNSFMSSQQVLNYPNNNVVSMDCSGSYLVTLDSSNYLAVDTYITNADVAALITLAGWIIGVIIGVVVLFVAAIVICIVCCCCRRRNKGAELALNNSMGQELIISSPSPQFNAQYNGNYNGQFNTQLSGPPAEVRFQTNAYGNNLMNPQPNVYVEANFEQKF